ncbi:MAG: hypothetical protein ABIS92_09630 [Polyangia bacterium]
MTRPRMISTLLPGALILVFGACSLDENGKAVLSIPAHHGQGSAADSGASGGIAGEGGTSGAGGDTGLGGTGGGFPDPLCGLGHLLTPWEPIEPEFSSEPLARGVGGSFPPGTYDLVRFVEHRDTSACLTRAGQSRYQVLVLRPDFTGTLVDEDNAFLDWPMTFVYSTREEYFLSSITCSPYGGSSGPNVPFGPFGPFETFTASGNQLTLFSPACGYQATFQLRSP